MRQDANAKGSQDVKVQNSHSQAGKRIDGFPGKRVAGRIRRGRYFQTLINSGQGDEIL
jgi:hypothetical protein